MSQEQAKQYILQGINAAKANQKDQARQLFQNAIRLDPQNESAWAWMSTVAKDNRERLFCFQNLLQINPRNEVALKGLEKLGVDSSTMLQKQQPPSGAKTPTAAPGASTVPSLPPDRLNAVMPSLDEFIRSYKPVPIAETGWEQKRSGLYGIAAARRRQLRVYGLLAAAASVVIIVLVVGLASLLEGEDVPLVAGRPTFPPTNTPTATPTATPGVTSTPSPEAGNPLPTFEPPDNLIEGDIYGGTPTPFYPVISSGAGRDFELAVAQYSIGQYEPAFALFARRQQEAEARELSCEAQAYYYHAIGLAEQGGRKNLEDAEALIRRAVARPLCVNDKQSRALINTAACVVDYLQGLETGDTSQYAEAITLCESAIEDIKPERPIVLSVTTLARLYALNENFDAAANVLDDALASWPNDINLMLVRARIELQRPRLDVALNYISRALYVDPTSEVALRLRVEAFLQTAAQENNRQRRIQLYGTAVIWTQEYLLFYPGKPAGYLLMAQARLGEGNIDLAEEALNRVIEARRQLPESEQSVVLEAFRLRSQIYIETARYEPALEDVEFLLGLSTGDADPELLEQRMNLAYQLGRYQQVLEDISALTEINGENTDLQLLRLKLITQVCEFATDIECDYEAAAEVLSNEFVNELTGADRAEALSYRAKATYHLTTEDGTLSRNERNRRYQAALADMDAALAVNENGLDLYYRGLLLEALDNQTDALHVYEYVAYWAQFYDYPFLEEMQAHIESLREEA
ncbi:MAG: hypothetical protein KJ064_24570 [Anaerolineae bacterium]|nr:hypothetical protein [Anaerolineae bacterium]